MKRYAIVIEKGATNYGGYVPDLPGCVATGATSEQRPTEQIPLTIYLSADVASRLKLAAEAQKRSAVDLAADLLDRHLPRPQTGGPKRSIPYS